MTCLALITMTDNLTVTLTHLQTQNLVLISGALLAEEIDGLLLTACTQFHSYQCFQVVRNTLLQSCYTNVPKISHGSGSLDP